MYNDCTQGYRPNMIQYQCLMITYMDTDLYDTISMYYDYIQGCRPNMIQYQCIMITYKDTDLI